MAGIIVMPGYEREKERERERDKSLAAQTSCEYKNFPQQLFIAQNTTFLQPGNYC